VITAGFNKQTSKIRVRLGAMSNNVQKPDLSSRLERTDQELKDLQHLVRTGTINVKVLMEFRNASERARQASAAVRDWLEAQGKGNDPYQLMPRVMSQRVEMATELLKDVTHDLESGDVDFETPGLAELNRTLRTLLERIGRFFPQ
jgi:hypothetical protein